ncbi:ABC transporter substrate-binding protein [Leucobacter sp. cx-328]|uniref:ABC transporter substrate-binding protein n=1 Tax=unclassified Leucobacter TaxID=2621730 RepID=UPI00165DAEDA|nr:ABC transporter substrate-binding protein [Leucobacter sp. cx-328]
MAFPSILKRGAAIGALTIASALTLTLTACGGAPAAEESTGNAVVQPPAILTADALTVCTGDTPPNIFYDENNELQGVEIDIANGLATELGVKTKLEEYNFSGLIPALQAKQCDVIMGSLYIKPEREEIANFVPYLFSGTGAGVTKENPKKVTGFDQSLCGIRVIGISGATGGDSATKLSEECIANGKPAIDLTLVDDAAAAVQQVLANQVDAFVDTSEIMSFYETQSEGDFVMIGEPFGKIRIGAATLKSNTELNEALDTAFTAMVDSGKYKEILATWGVEANDITLGE